MGHLGNPRSFRLSHRCKGRHLMNMPGFLDYKLKSWLKRPSRFSPHIRVFDAPLTGFSNKTLLGRWFTGLARIPRFYQNSIRKVLVAGHPSWNQLWFNKYSYASSFFPFFSVNNLFGSKKSFFNFSLRKKLKNRVSPGGFFSHSFLLAKPNDKIFFRPFFVSKYLNNLKQYYPDYISMLGNRIFAVEQKPFLGGSLLYERKTFAQPRISEKARYPSFKEGFHANKYLTYDIFLESIQDKLYPLLADNVGRHAYLSEVLQTPYKHYQKPDKAFKKLTIRTGPGRSHKKVVWFPNNMDIKYLKDVNVLRSLLSKRFITGINNPRDYFSDIDRSVTASCFLRSIRASVRRFLASKKSFAKKVPRKLPFDFIPSMNSDFFKSVQGISSIRSRLTSKTRSKYGFFNKELVEQLDKHDKPSKLANRIFTKEGSEKTTEKIRQHHLWEGKKGRQ